MVELVDTPVLGTGGVTPVEVRVLFSVPLRAFTTVPNGNCMYLIVN